MEHQSTPPIEVHCFDAWAIAYSHARMEHIAKASLERHGYECWYPIRKVVSMRPKATISSKTRHRRRHEVVERLEPVLPGYLFIRRLWADVAPLHELPGVGGLCMFGPDVAELSDREIELLRLAEADGKFNTYAALVPMAYRWSISGDPRQWAGATRDLGTRLDKSGDLTQFTEAFGRVLRLVYSARKALAP